MPIPNEILAIKRPSNTICRLTVKTDSKDIYPGQAGTQFPDT